MNIRIPSIQVVCREGRFLIPEVIEFNFVNNTIKVICGGDCGLEKKCRSKNMQIKFGSSGIKEVINY